MTSRSMNRRAGPGSRIPRARTSTPRSYPARLTRDQIPLSLDRIPDVGGVRRADHLEHVEVDVLVEPFKQPLPSAEDHRSRRDNELVDASGGQRLADQVCTAADRYVLVASRLRRLRQRVVESGHEGES